MPGLAPPALPADAERGCCSEPLSSQREASEPNEIYPCSSRSGPIKAAPRRVTGTVDQVSN